MTSASESELRRLFSPDAALESIWENERRIAQNDGLHISELPLQTVAARLGRSIDGDPQHLEVIGSQRVMVPSDRGDFVVDFVHPFADPADVDWWRRRVDLAEAVYLQGKAELAKPILVDGQRSFTTMIRGQETLTRVSTWVGGEDIEGDGDSSVLLSREEWESAGTLLREISLAAVRGGLVLPPEPLPWPNDAAFERLGLTSWIRPLRSRAASLVRSPGPEIVFPGVFQDLYVGGDGVVRMAGISDVLMADLGHEAWRYLHDVDRLSPSEDYSQMQAFLRGFAPDQRALQNLLMDLHWRALREQLDHVSRQLAYGTEEEAVDALEQFVSSSWKFRDDDRASLAVFDAFWGPGPDPEGHTYHLEP